LHLFQISIILYLTHTTHDIKKCQDKFYKHGENMKKKKAIKRFKNMSGIARALNITPQCVGKWGEDIPALRAYQLNEIMMKQDQDALKKKLALRMLRESGAEVKDTPSYL